VSEVVALDRVDLVVQGGELLVVVGPSGSGKTTLLRCVAGLEDPDAGSVTIGSRDVTSVPPGERDVAMVFQDYALYPHLTVEANIVFGLRARKASSTQTAQAVSSAASLLGLSGILQRRPDELSGGERQRVALARAIVREPNVFLLDEPLSNLDAELRTNMRAEIKALQRRLRTTTIYVTHDQIEAMTMGDRVAVLRKGTLEQVDAPKALYERPATAFVARFMGSPPMNLFPSDLLGVRDGAPTVGVRPERLRLVPSAVARLRGVVRAIEPAGDVTLLHADVAGHRFVVKLRDAVTVDVSEEIGLAFDEGDVYRFDPDGRALR
jgi:ABC-type sugar transport system ATPase subunit